MPEHGSLLDDLRRQYEAARASQHTHSDVPGFQEIDARLRKTFRWLEKAVAYLDGLRPSIRHRFDLGHGIAFDDPRFARGFVGHHEQRIVGYPVLDEINISYQIETRNAPTILTAPGGAGDVEKTLEDVGLQYTAHRVEDADGIVRKCAISVPASIPATVEIRVDYRTGVVPVTLVNVDRFDRVSLDFRSDTLDEPALEDLVRLILGESGGFLRRAPLAGIGARRPNPAKS